MNDTIKPIPKITRPNPFSDIFRNVDVELKHGNLSVKQQMENAIEEFKDDLDAYQQYHMGYVEGCKDTINEVNKWLDLELGYIITQIPTPRKRKK